jgi:hypothetical protein
MKWLENAETYTGTTVRLTCYEMLVSPTRDRGKGAGMVVTARLAQKGFIRWACRLGNIIMSTIRFVASP